MVYLTITYGKSNLLNATVTNSIINQSKNSAMIQGFAAKLNNARVHTMRLDIYFFLGKGSAEMFINLLKLIIWLRQSVAASIIAQNNERSAPMCNFIVHAIFIRVYLKK